MLARPLVPPAPAWLTRAPAPLPLGAPGGTLWQTLCCVGCSGLAARTRRHSWTRCQRVPQRPRHEWARVRKEAWQGGREPPGCALTPAAATAAGPTKSAGRMLVAHPIFPRKRVSGSEVQAVNQVNIWQVVSSSQMQRM